MIPISDTRLYTFTSCTMEADFSMLVQATRIGKTADVPVSYFLIDHEQGTILFDSGLSYHGIIHPEEHGYPEDFPVDMESEDRIEPQLQKASFEPSDVDYVVLSHLHFDHTGGIKPFRDARFFVHRNELRYAFWPDPVQQEYYCLTDFGMLRDDAVEVQAIQRDWDLFGDGSVVLLELPGHTPGHLGLQVELETEGTVVLAADSAHHRVGYEANLGTPFDTNYENAVESFDRLRQLEITDDARIVLSHDPQQISDLPSPPDCLT